LRFTQKQIYTAIARALTEKKELSSKTAEVCKSADIVDVAVFLFIQKRIKIQDVEESFRDSILTKALFLTENPEKKEVFMKNISTLVGPVEVLKEEKKDIVNVNDDSVQAVDRIVISNEDLESLLSLVRDIEESRKQIDAFSDAYFAADMRIDKLEEERDIIKKKRNSEREKLASIGSQFNSLAMMYHRLYNIPDGYQISFPSGKIEKIKKEK